MPKIIKINGVRVKKCNLTQNQVLIVDNVITGGHSDGKEVETGDILALMKNQSQKVSIVF